MTTRATTRPDALGHVADRLDALVGAFGLEAEAARVRAVFDAICGRALAFPLAEGPAGRSRLTEDGTPVQFATSVGAGPAALRFVADPGPFHAGAARTSAAVTITPAIRIGPRAFISRCPIEPPWSSPIVPM